MNLSVNIGNIMWHYSFSDSADIYKKAGFTACDYSVMRMIEDGNIFNTDGYREFAESERRVADEKGFPITQTHAPFAFKKELFLDPIAFEEIIFKRVARSIEISGILGAKTVIVHPLTYLHYPDHVEELFELNMRYYRRLIPYAKDAGVKIAIENMFTVDPLRKFIVGSTCADPNELVRYVDTLDSEEIVACLDIGHVALPLHEYTAVDAIRILGHDRLKALHVHDNDYRADRHVLPYLGSFDWMAIAKALGEIDYDGDFTYEVAGSLILNRDPGFIPIGAKFMADVGKHIMAEIDRNRPNV